MQTQAQATRAILLQTPGLRNSSLSCSLMYCSVAEGVLLILTTLKESRAVAIFGLLLFLSSLIIFMITIIFLFELNVYYSILPL